MTRKITALKLQKKNRERINVYLDGEFAFGLAHIVAGWLRVGQELSESEIAELQAQDELEVAYQRALNYLGYRPRSSEEVRRNLRKKDTSEEVIEEVLARLEKHNFVDDDDFATAWVEDRSTFRPRGRYALRTELRQKGLSDRVIERALEDLDEESLAYRAARKQAPRYKKFEWQEFRRKLSGYLSRRGFSYAIIADIIPTIWEEQSDSVPPTDSDNSEVSL